MICRVSDSSRDCQEKASLPGRGENLERRPKMPFQDEQPEAEKYQSANTIDEFGPTATLIDAFRSTTRRHPNKTAFHCGKESISYRSLNQRTSHLARLLVARHGVKRGDLIIVALDRSIDLIVALLAVLKAGATYVPVDTSFPARRVEYMVEDADPKLMICRDETLCTTLSQWKEICLDIDDTAGDDRHTSRDGGLCKVRVDSNDLAYIIYTSGSTGRPKGVEISHGSVLNFLQSMRNKPGCNESDRILAVTTICFDIAVLELFLPLISGATTVIAQEHHVRDTTALLDLMGVHQITMMQATPATWYLLLEAGWNASPRLHKILCGGERLSRRLADQLLDHAESVWNMYGPTETTVWSCLWNVLPGEDVFVGEPIANTQLYILDSELHPVPQGASGELYIGGAGVSQGYHQNTQLTQERFIGIQESTTSRVYRTGDLARSLGAGKLQILGRTDDQLKLRGYRIEPGEIEMTLIRHPHVSKAAVVSRNEQLVAFFQKTSDQPAKTNRDASEGAKEWAGAWDHVYSSENGTRSDTNHPNQVLNLAGWRNSYDGLPIPTPEMEDWQLASVRRILSYSPRRVIEVGSGTGMMLFKVAPHCEMYHAVDSSAQAIEFIKKHLHQLPHVICEQRQAHELMTQIEQKYDTVVVNSVVQYFPSVSYLLAFIDWACGVVDQGRIYLGDIRNLDLITIFHGDILHSHDPDGLSFESLASKAVAAAKDDRELLLAPEFFAHLPELDSRITRVEIALRDGAYHNEMTRFRYDVTLHVGENKDFRSSVICRELDLGSGTLDEQQLRAELATVAADLQPLYVPRILNARVQAVYDRIGQSLAEYGTIATGTHWIDPQTVNQLAAQAGLESILLPSKDPWRFDALIWHSTREPDTRFCTPRPVDKLTLARSANQPRTAKDKHSNDSDDTELRSWLVERLPHYMVPSVFVELQEFPLTPNRKIDRKALPESVPRPRSTAQPGKNDLEQKIQSIWSEILDLDAVDTRTSFFQIGGDSLRVIRVQTAIEKLIGRSISSAKLYEHYTIESLAVYLAQDTSPDATQNASEGRAITQSRNDDVDDIAVISLACRLPGDISTPEDFWKLLERGGDATTDVPYQRWDAERLYDADPDAAGKTYCKRGGFLSSINSRDLSFFGISPGEAASLDPMQYIMLETCWDAFERAGFTQDQLRGSSTGVFVGISSLPAYGASTNTSLEDLGGYAGTGSAGSVISGRVSYCFGLEGPAMTVDTACSSSLVTTHLACTALRQGECDLAVSAGVSLLLSPAVFVEFSRLKGIAPDGRCRAFSADTEGTGWSEGSAAVVLKRLTDAQRDGDRIHAVLRGTAVNHDGRSASLTAPNGSAQRRLIQTALASSKLRAGHIDYVETHGTATTLGDQIEGTALAEVFGSRPLTDAEPLWIGSAKSNLGHTQAAAGLVGLIKVVLSMQHGIMPISLHVTDPTPMIDWTGSHMAVVQKRRIWRPRTDRRRAGVSAFGISGTNAHIIVEEALPESKRSMTPENNPQSLPVLISGRTKAALRAQALKLKSHLLQQYSLPSLADLAFSLATSRTHFEERAILMVSDRNDLMAKLDKLAAATIEQQLQITQTPRIAFLFTGQGSQVRGMGRDLAAHFPVFRETIFKIAAHFDHELERPLVDVMWEEGKPDGEDLLQRTDFAQSALFTFETAMCELWASWGIRPDLLLGHSIGELVAAYVGGVLDLPDACRLVAARGRLMQGLTLSGQMISIQANAQQVALAIREEGYDGQVDIASHNTPMQTVASGDPGAIEKLKKRFSDEGRKCTKLNVSRAFHSHHMDSILKDFQQVADTIQFRAQTSSIVSSMTGKCVEAGELQNSEYWTRQARQAVHFCDGIHSLVHEGINTFLEVGPQPVLSGMGAATLEHEASRHDIQNTVPQLWLASASARRSDLSVILDSLIELHRNHAQIQWDKYFSSFNCERVDLPTYAFQREETRSNHTPFEALSLHHTNPLSPKVEMGDAVTKQISQHLRNTSPDKQSGIALSLVRDTVARTLGIISTHEIDVTVPLEHVGVDSLNAPLVRRQLSPLIDSPLPFQATSLRRMSILSISESILGQLQDLDSAPSSLETSLSAGDSIISSHAPSVHPTDKQHFRENPAPSSIQHPPSVATGSSHAFLPRLGQPLFDPSEASYSATLHYLDSLEPLQRLFDGDSKLFSGNNEIIPFIPQCFSSASAKQDQFLGRTLSSTPRTRPATHAVEAPPIRYALSLIQPSDRAHINDVTRHISSVTTVFALGEGTSGHEGILHGGFTSTLLDESISIILELNTSLKKCANVFKGRNVTASLNIRFLEPIISSEPAVVIKAWIEAIHGRNTHLSAKMTNLTGQLLAEAESTFVTVG